MQQLIVEPPMRPQNITVFERPDPLLDTVSTTCGSGWVRSLAATLIAAHPPATAGGTDCVQEKLTNREG